MEPEAERAPWWRHAVIYQVYVRSFADSDGDGVGDLAGIRTHLDHIRNLGVDAIWLNPFYPSPQADGGYDVADYRDVDPRFGSLDDFDALVSEVHASGLRLIVDLVPNHTSSEHAWFRAALADAPGSRARQRYLFRDGRGPRGDEPPNDWRSMFGGSAWTRTQNADGTPGQWYLHLFAPEQPDLDWTNDEVRVEFDAILRFWLDRGVDGFRIDVAHGLAKDPDMPDLTPRRAGSGSTRARHPHWDLDEVHDVYRRWRRITDGYANDPMFVAEAWVDSPQRLARYVRPDELHTAFNFDFLLAPFEPPAMRDVIDETIETLAAVGAAPTWVLSNHDVEREVTRYGGGELGARRARAAGLLMLALPGSAYVYQGQELGLPEVIDLPDELREDPSFLRTRGAVRGRDGCRVPIPWSGSAPPFSFGPGGAWLPQPKEWAERSVARQSEDPGSMLNLYRRALRIRRAHDVAELGKLSWMRTGRDVLAFRRGPHFACVVNFGAGDTMAPRSLGDAAVLLSSAPLRDDGRIPRATAVWYAPRHA
jgi:alpha-glucosidase